MKRVIKYWDSIGNDPKFSDCSTKYEILPYIVDNHETGERLVEIANELGLEFVGNVQYFENPLNRPGRITHYLQLKEKIEMSYSVEKQKTVRLGFITLNTDGPLKPSVEPNQIVDEESAHEIINSQHYGVNDLGEHVDGGTVLVKSGWNFYHEIPLLGYDLDHLVENIWKIDKEGFYDDTFRCYECNIFDFYDNGYEKNYRVIDGALLGINCGCHNEYCEDNWREIFINNTDQPLEPKTAQKLAANKEIVFCERFIGGMTDRRGGYWHGSGPGNGPCREGDPETVLQEYLDRNPEEQYVFTFDEAGQFRSYFSIWRVVD